MNEQNEHRLYIVLGLLLLVMGALAVRRADAVGAVAFLLAGAGVVANGMNALRKRFIPRSSPTMARVRISVLLLGIIVAIVLIVLEE
jgi:uncharacterized membrane protein HdeD (DUF308 family)